MREIIFWTFSASSVTDPSQFWHKITDEVISIKMDSAKITGIDYHKQESRNAKIEFLNDDSSFVQLNFINQVTPISENSPFFYYFVRILEDGNIIFTGWVKRTSIKYDKKSDKIKLTASNVISVLVETGKEKITYNEDTIIDIDNLLYLILNQTIGNTGTPSFNIDFNLNYTKETGITQTGMTIPIQDTDFGTDWANFYDNSGNWWDSPIEWDTAYHTNTYGSQHYGLINSHNILALRIDSADDKPQLIMMKYYKTKYKQRFSFEDDFNYYIKENLLLKKCKFDSLFSPYDFFSHSFGNETFCPTEAIQTNIYENEQLYQDYLGMDLPSEKSISVTGFDEHESTIYLESLIEDPITVNYTGYMAFDLITIKQGTYSKIDILKMILTMNNLTIKNNKTGSIEIINKNYSIGNTSIAESDIIDFSQSAVQSSEIDYSSLLTPLSDNTEVIASALSSYYSEAIPDYEYELEILNNYDLNLNDKITVLNKTMYIVDIGLDRDKFSYKIKAWSV